VMNGHARTNGYRRPSFLRAYRRDSPTPFRLVSTGLDPQILLPPLKDDVRFPLVITIEMTILPASQLDRLWESLEKGLP
jgi:hypothetical protein